MDQLTEASATGASSRPPIMDARIGRRRPASGLALDWFVSRTTRSGTATKPEPIHAVDVSVSGLLVSAATVPGLTAGDQIDVEYLRMTATAAVRRVEPSADPAVTRYGLELLDAHADLVDGLLSGAGAPLRPAIEGLWQRSH